MPEDDNARAILTALALLLLFVVGTGSSVVSVMLLAGSSTKIDGSGYTIPASIFAIASAYSFGQLVSALRPR